MKQRIAFSVEKFIPTHCPNVRCLNPFDVNPIGEFDLAGINPFNRFPRKGYSLVAWWKADDHDPARKIFPAAYKQQGLASDVVICNACSNHTLRVLIEYRVYVDKADAVAALDQGFVNLQSVSQTGTHAEEGDTVDRFLA